MPKASIWAIPAFHDNYIWVAQRESSVVVVDPGDAAAVEKALQTRSLQLTGILVTHHHWDHVGGLRQLLRKHDVPVFGPAVDQRSIPQIDHGLGDGDHVTLPQIGLELDVMTVPGHTLDHIAYHGLLDGQPIVFCGDTLFSAGCGRLFEGEPATMHASLRRLAGLPAETAVYCTHEYTQANLRFALAVDPENQALLRYSERVKELRSQNKPSLPSTIGLELEINPFMRCHTESVRKAAAAHATAMPDNDIETFAAIRRWKDSF